MKKEIIKVKHVKPIQEELYLLFYLQVILFTSNYWCLCQNRCSWNMFWPEDQRICSWNFWKYMYSSSSLLVHKRCFAGFCQQILVAGGFHVNSKFISQSSFPLQRVKSFIQYQAAICCSMKTSPVNRLVLFLIFSW